jgi:hypothetical protein
VVVNKLSAEEAALAKDIVAFRGGIFVGQVKRDLPGIDGFLDGVPVSLKKADGGLSAVLSRVSKAEAQARNAGYTGVEVFVRAPNVDLGALVDFAQKGPLTKIPTQGTISAINVLTAGGWVRIIGGPL